MRVRTHRSLAAAGLLALATVAGALAPTAANAAGAAAHTNRTRTVHLVRTLLADVALPHGAKQRATAPVRALRRAGEIEPSPNLVHHKHWFVVPGSVSHTLSYARRQPAPGCRFYSGGSSHGPGQPVVHDINCYVHSTRYADSVSHTLSYARRHPAPGCRFYSGGSSHGPGQPVVHDINCYVHSTRYADYVLVDLQAVATGHGTAVRADSEAVWVPTRPAYSTVTDPYGVRVVVERHHEQPTVHRTLGASKAEHLARVLNRLTVEPPVALSCPAQLPGVVDRLHFRTPSGPMTATAYLTGCPVLSIAVAHHHSVTLSLTGLVDRTVRSLLHLPRRYRR